MTLGRRSPQQRRGGLRMGPLPLGRFLKISSASWVCFHVGPEEPWHTTKV